MEIRRVGAQNVRRSPLVLRAVHDAVQTRRGMAAVIQTSPDHTLELESGDPPRLPRTT